MNIMRSKKQTITVIFLVLMTSLIFLSSCANVKRDCQGNKKYRQSNGVWI